MAGGLRCAVRKQCSGLAGGNERCKVLTKCQQHEGSRAGRWGICIGLRFWNVPDLVPVWTMKPIFIFLSLIVTVARLLTHTLRLLPTDLWGFNKFETSHKWLFQHKSGVEFGCYRRMIQLISGYCDEEKHPKQERHDS